MFCGTCVVSDRKDTKLLKANHNMKTLTLLILYVVSDRKDTKLLKANHNVDGYKQHLYELFQTAKILNF